MSKIWSENDKKVKMSLQKRPKFDNDKVYCC